MKDRIAELEERLASVERRLSELEGKPHEGSAPGDPAPGPAPGDNFVSHASTHIGHAMLIFGGAYLLRAITDFHFVPTAIGLVMGAAYALAWLYVAYRKGHVPGQHTTAAIYGGISMALLMPLLVEAADRFQLLSGVQAVAALMLYCALVFGVAVTRDLKSLAWLVTVGGIASAIGITVATLSAVAASGFLILLGLGSLWVVYGRGWRGLQWLGAFGANIGVIALIVVGTSDQWALGPDVAAVFALLLVLVYLISFAIRTHLRHRTVDIFESMQAVFVGAIAFLASAIAVRDGQFSVPQVGTLCVVLGVAFYALAFTPHTRGTRGRNFFFYSMLGMAFVVAGTAWMMSPPGAAFLWSVLALVLAGLSGRTGWVAMSLQCSILLLAAGIDSGLLSAGLAALAGAAGESWPSLIAVYPGVAIATLLCLLVPVAQQAERWGRLAEVPQIVVLALSVWEVGGLAVMVLAPWIADVKGADPNLAALAALRTAVLSVAAVALALSSRFRRWPEARWLAYPLLVLVAIKLFAEDFPNGNAASLFVALAFVGTALLLVAKLVPRSEDAAEAEQAG